MKLDAVDYIKKPFNVDEFREVLARVMKKKGLAQLVQYCYLRWGLHGKADWKAWWHAIERATQEKISRNQRRGRPLE